MRNSLLLEGGQCEECTEELQPGTFAWVDDYNGEIVCFDCRQDQEEEDEMNERHFDDQHKFDI